MSYEVYVCYDEEDKQVAEDVYSALKNRKLQCWMKSQDVKEDVVKEMMEAINNSYVMVLIYSARSKFSDYVNTEVDMAFSNKIPIMVFRTDDSKIDGALEFFLKQQPKFNAYEDPDGELTRMLDTTQRLVKEKKTGIGDVIKEHKIPIVIGLAVILIAAVCIYMFMPADTTVDTVGSEEVDAGNFTLKVTQFKVEDVSKKGYGWNYSYFARGTISPMPAKGSGLIISADFFDKTGKLVNTTETPFDDLQMLEDGFLFGSAVSDTKDIARVEVELVNGKNIVLAQGDGQLKNVK